MSFVHMNNSMRFLIIDSVSGNADVLKQMLKKMGYSNFLTAVSGLDGLNIIKTQSVDFIFCRQKLTDMLGTDLFADLKADLSIKRIPFAVFSESLAKGDEALLIEMGVDSFLNVPFSSRDVAEKVAATWSRYINTNNVEYHFEKGRRALMQNKLDEAAETFIAIIESKRIVNRTKIALARVERKVKNYQRAKELALQVLNDDPNFIHAHQFLGELHLELNDPVAALESFGKGLALSPKNPYRYQVCGDILCSLSMWKDALAVYDKAVENAITATEVLEGRATTLVQLDKKKEALGVYRSLLVREPKNVKFLNNLAVCHKGLKEEDDAIEAYRKAIEIEPNNPKILYNVSLLYIVKDKLPLAKNYLKKAFECDPKFEKARLKLLQLENPAAYQEEIKKLGAKDVQEISNGDTSIEVRQRIVKRFDFSGESVKRIKGLADSIAKLESAKTQDKPTAIAPIVIDEAKIAFINAADEEALKSHYVINLKDIRISFARYMSKFFENIGELSEQLVLSMFENVQEIMGQSEIAAACAAAAVKQERHYDESIRKLISSTTSLDARVKVQVTPIITALQFQDGMRQSLLALSRGYQFFTLGFGDVVWTQFEKTLPTIEERQILQRVMKSLNTPAGQSLPLPYRYWVVFNEFLDLHMKDITERVSKANQALLEQTESVAMMMIELQDTSKKLSSLLNWGAEHENEQALNEIKEAFVENSPTDIALRSMVALVQHSILIQARLKRFMKTASLVDILYVQNLKSLNSLRENLLKFGPDLTYIWKYCEAYCTNRDERQMLAAAISNQNSSKVKGAA